ncbi:transcriptional regulator [Pseudomonas aeruginosa]|nr:helix-turn-helix transcriptional regulator [Pseudomonas aeruginosa]MCO3636142.1 helix-turn-helix transcriptional regulator [Pseudomonas aeruginosa]RPO29006.1 transcriptional regulator [Pseudomonas aeruginosa]
MNQDSATSLPEQEGTSLILENNRVTLQPVCLPKDECQEISSVLSRAGDKWSVIIIVMLGPGPLRLNELKRMIGSISQRMLTLTLRGLERDGLVTRTQFSTIPPRVDYELTEMGHSLLIAVQPLGSWAKAHVKDVKIARAAYDQRALISSEINPEQEL